MLMLAPELMKRLENAWYKLERRRHREIGVVSQFGLDEACVAAVELMVDPPPKPNPAVHYHLTTPVRIGVVHEDNYTTVATMESDECKFIAVGAGQEHIVVDAGLVRDTAEYRLEGSSEYGGRGGGHPVVVHVPEPLATIFDFDKGRAPPLPAPQKAPLAEWWVLKLSQVINPGKPNAEAVGGYYGPKGERVDNMWDALEFESLEEVGKALPGLHYEECRLFQVEVIRRSVR